MTPTPNVDGADSPWEHPDEFLTRKAVRHRLVRLRNERIATTRDDAWPLQMLMAHTTHEELLVDGDGGEQHTLDFEGRAFMNVPITVDDRLAHGVIQLVWPTPQPSL